MSSSLPITSVAMSPQQERALYIEGIRLFNSHEFFEAHEVWEEVWRTSTGINREYYQGLIQCAVALEHYRRGNPRGVVSLYNSYRKHFSHVPPIFMGLDINSFLQEMRGSLKPVLDRMPPPQRGEISLDGVQVPRLAVELGPGEELG